MVDTDALRGLIVQRRLTQDKVAKMLNITPKTFYAKMKIGEFKTSEVDKLIEILKIENIVEIFFANHVPDDGTK